MRPDLGLQPINELVVTYDPAPTLERVARRRRHVRSRLIGLVITGLFLLALGLWWCRRVLDVAVLVGYGVVLAISLAWLAVAYVGYRQAVRQARSLGSGIALRVDRRGVELAGRFVGWGQVTSLGAARAGLGRPPVLQLSTAEGVVAAVPFDQLGVRPATIDSAARAFSAGRHGVDLAALDN